MEHKTRTLRSMLTCSLLVCGECGEDKLLWSQASLYGPTAANVLGVQEMPKRSSPTQRGGVASNMTLTQPRARSRHPLPPRPPPPRCRTQNLLRAQNSRMERLNSFPHLPAGAPALGAEGLTEQMGTRTGRKLVRPSAKPSQKEHSGMSRNHRGARSSPYSFAQTSPRHSSSELKWPGCPVPQSPVQVIPAAVGGTRTPEPHELDEGRSSSHVVSLLAAPMR